MAKTIFRPNEIKPVNDMVMLQLTKNFVVEEEPEEEIMEPVYEGPTASDLKREADEFKMQWAEEKKQLIATAQTEADEIIKKAHDTAFEEVKRQTEQSQIIRTDAEAKAAEIIKVAQQEAERIIADAQNKKGEIETAAHEAGFNEGKEVGYKDGEAEVNRLIDRLHVIIDRVMEKREDILNTTEQQIVDLVLLITRKVVKVISESQRNVIMANVLQALRKVKGRGDVTIRVNMSDVKLITEHAQDFMKSVETVKNITVVEDTSIDQGGCIIETDFGAIDARIASQLGELEQKILEISPIKTMESSKLTV